MNKLELSATELAIIKNILSKYPYEFYAFGSRTNGKSQRFSDLDLCYYGSMPIKDLSAITTEFAESELPFTVDLVAFDNCNAEFKKIIANDLIKIQ